MKQRKFNILSSDTCLKCEEWVNSHVLTRILTSFVVLAFFYGIFLFFYEIKFLRQIIPVVHPFLIAWAGGLTLYNLLIRKTYTKLPYWEILFLFLFSAAITTVITLEAGIVSNIKSWILVALPLFAFYPVCLQGDKEKTTKSLIISTLGASIVVFLASLVAIVMYLIRFSQTISIAGIEETLGFIYYYPNDPSSGVILYGAYVDTNHASVYSIIFSTLSVILFVFCKKELFAKKWQNKIGKIYAIANIIVQLCYFPLANSRGGWLSLVVAVFIVGFLFFYCTKLTLKNKALKTITAFVLAMVCVASTTLGLLALRTGVSQATVLTEKVVEYVQKLGSTGGPATPDKLDTQLPSADKFEKTDDGTGSGRLLIWKETIGLYVERPVFGVGPGNTEYFGMKYDIPGEKIKYGADVHSSYLDLLAEYGIVGFVAMTTFWALCLVTVIKDLFKNGIEKGISYYMCAFAVLFISGASAFLSCVFINTTAMYFMMLLLVGHLLSKTNLKGCDKNELSKD